VETDFSDYSQATTSGPDFSSASMGLSDEAMASIGSDENQDQNFFGGPDTPNVMDFGRGPVSNISDTSSFDPNFAALQMIGRGLTPSSALRNQISFDVPSQMLPQLEGSRGPLAPKFYSPVERTLVEMEPVGIGAMIGKAFESVKNSFNEAKDTLGKMGNAVGGLSLSDLGIFSSNTGQKAMADMEDNVSFDQFGRRIDLGDTRQISNFPQVQIPTVDTTPNLLDTNMDMADASQFLNPQVISQGLNYFAGPQIQEFFRGVTNNPNTTIRLGPGFDMNKREVDDNIFSINIPFATG
jgi:hypothetical protein